MSENDQGVRTPPRRPLGRLPQDKSLPRLQLEKYLTAKPTPPPSADYTVAPELPMFGNDVCGDCVFAGLGHEVEILSYYGQGTEAEVTDDQVISAYSAVAGYDPQTGRNDNGATLQQGLNYWRKTGLGGRKVEAFAEIKITDLDLVRNCIALFGSVYVGMNFPAFAMDQFDEDKMWSVQSENDDIEGGHCVVISGYDSTTFTCITWAKAQAMTVEFFQKYFDEAWVPLDQDWISGKGSPAGLDVDTLNADYKALTGKDGPFVAVTPTPEPQPQPEPQPTPSPDPSPAPQPDSDPAATLVAAVEQALADYKAATGS